MATLLFVYVCIVSAASLLSEPHAFRDTSVWCRTHAFCHRPHYSGPVSALSSAEGAGAGRFGARLGGGGGGRPSAIDNATHCH